MAFWEHTLLFMPVRTIRSLVWKAKIAGPILAIALLGQLQAAVNVYAPPELQKDFISTTTNYYVATITPSPYFQGTYTINLTGKRNFTPPVVSSPIVDSSAFDRCFVHGFVFGMESERKDDLTILKGLSDDVRLTNTCSGLIAGTTVPATAFLNGCSAAYGIAISTITERYGLPPPVIVP